jgi:hypothetical protein
MNGSGTITGRRITARRAKDRGNRVHDPMVITPIPDRKTPH